MNQYSAIHTDSANPASCMPKSSDFEKIYKEFLQKYGSEKGEKLYYAYVNKHGYNDSKSMDAQKKEFRDSLIRGYEIKEEADAFIVKGFIATTHKDSVGDIIQKETLDKWAEEINNGNPRVNKVSYHHDREDPRVVGVGIKGTAKVLPIGNEFGLFVESKINKVHPLFDDIQYESQNDMLDAFSIEYDSSKGSLMQELAGVQTRFLMPETDLYGWTLASRPINENAVILKEALSMEDKAKHKMEEEEDMDESKMSEEEKKKMKKKKMMMNGKKKESDFNEVINSEVNTMAEESKESISPVSALAGETKEFSMDGVVKHVLESKEFKEAVGGIKVENKAMFNKDEGSKLSLEMKEWKEAIKSDGKLSIEEQFRRAGRLAEKAGIIDKQIFRKEGGLSAEVRSQKLMFKNFGTNGRKLEYKDLGVTTNQNTDTDYLLSSAELADVFDPVIYNALNEKVVAWSVLPKDDYSQKGNNQVQFTLKTAANTTAAFYSGNSVSLAQSTRQKYQTKFKKVQVGVAVDGEMIAAARGGPIGDVFAQEVQDATETMLSVMNVQLFAETGLETATQPIGFAYISDNAGNGTLYNVTRSDANKLAPAANADTYINGASANVTLALLRQAIRQCVTDGSNKNDLVFFVDPVQEDKIKALFDDLARYNSPKETRFGFESQLFVDGVPVFVDKDAAASDVWLVDLSSLRIAIWVPPTLEMLGKRGDNEEGFIKSYYAVYSRAPRRLVQIYDLATT